MKVFPRLLAVGATLTVAAMAIAVSGSATAAPSTPPGIAAEPAALAAQTVDALVAGHPDYLLAGSNEAFTQQKVISSAGIQYVPYERTYRGLPVVGGDFVIGTNSAGQVLFHSVAQDHPIGDLATSPSVTSAEAAKVAGGQLRSVTKVEGTRLVVYALGDTPRLAWESTQQGTGAEGYSRLSVVVDALTGTVLTTREHVMHGTGTAAYSGPNPVTLNTTSSGGTFRMQDPTMTTLQCQDAANNTTFSGPDDLWGNGNATSRETGCVDGFFAAQQERAMLTQWLGRNGFDGAGGAWPIRVGLADLNAFYDGTQVQIGHNQGNQWISSVDVVAHELGHGIDDHTPGGISGSGTQEFIADTFGASTEWFSNQPAAFDPPDYLVGEEINLVGTGPIRNMYNPSLVNGDPNCYSSSIPGGEVHASAGPGNHWFYLLSQGSNPTNGQPTSPTCNSQTVGNPVGPQNAIKILYNAMLMKTTSSSYLKYRTWTLQAAKNLDASCAMFNTTKAAWDAVSVPAQTADPTCSGGPTPLALANPGTQNGTVGTAASLSLAATGGTTPYSFSATGLPAGLSINASSGVISGTPTTAATYSVTATVTDSASPPASASQTFSWVVSPVGSCSSPGQKLGNPGFETGTAPWTSTAGVIGAFAGQTAHSGTRFAWLDGYGTTHTDTLQQTVTLPAGCANYTLSFWLHIDSAETTTTTQFDKLTVTVGATTVATYSNLNKAAGYSLKSFNLAAFAGQTVVLKFTGTEDISLQTSFVVDDTALNVS
ncbi:zinc metalloprotease [Longispora fulva]|uniref:Zn-dependent metalloprotease n=2 Tax=Longispora fulva TaxID=619741 RepID=A0A8J7GFN7_9ACTN|nr:Zn-dependent metalloprotease [Longispora fulva]GIG59735.1 zinc metalloprotease [Longispora fulva]